MVSVIDKRVRRAFRAVGIPSVQWSDKYRQFFVRIGYRRSASGKRSRAYFYLGKVESEAVASAVALKVEWRKVKREAAKGNPSLVALGVAPAPAVWPNAERDEQARRAVDAYLATNAREQRDEDDDGEPRGPQFPRLTLAEVAERFKVYREGKVGIGGGEGINGSTYKGEQAHLRNALKFADADRDISSLDYGAIERWKDNIFRRVGEGKLAERSAVNYCKAFRALLDYAHRSAEVQYRHPSDVDDLFRFRDYTPINIAPYNAVQLKNILTKATERTRLYALLALNCGYYQSDISALRRDELVQHEGRWCIRRRRSKTSHQNTFETLHPLWAETYTLLAKHLAPANVDRLALLNGEGRKLTTANIGDYWRDARGEDELAFKQLRKIGASALERIGGEQARELYLGHAVKGVSKVYAAQAWSNLTAPLDRWADELRADKVLW